MIKTASYDFDYSMLSSSGLTIYSWIVIFCVEIGFVSLYNLKVNA